MYHVMGEQRKSTVKESTRLRFGRKACHAYATCFRAAGRCLPQFVCLPISIDFFRFSLGLPPSRVPRCTTMPLHGKVMMIPRGVPTGG